MKKTIFVWITHAGALAPYIDFTFAPMQRIAALELACELRSEHGRIPLFHKLVRCWCWWRGNDGQQVDAQGKTERDRTGMGNQQEDGLFHKWMRWRNGPVARICGLGETGATH